MTAPTDGFMDAPPPALREIPRIRGRQLDEAWKPIQGYGSWLVDQPPPREWLLRVPANEETGHDRGLLAQGIVGLLVSAGGVGKTMTLTQLAISVATGRPWLCGPNGEGGLLPPEPERRGRVLFAMGEEDAAEAHRRFFYAARSLDLTPDEIVAAQNSIVVLPLAGESVSLVQGGGFSREEVVASGLAVELHDRLTAGSGVLGPWSLVILDPLSRFAGLDTESDNAAATRFVQVLETLTKAPGHPTVLVAHHTSKTARREPTSDGTGARGSSALVDGVRWVAELTSDPQPKGAPAGTPRTASLTVTKSNYSAPLDEPIRLARGPNGELGMAPQSVLRAREQAAEDASEARARGARAAKRDAVIAVLKGTSAALSRNAIAEAAEINPVTASGILDLLVADGRVIRHNGQKGGFSWAP